MNQPKCPQCAETVAVPASADRILREYPNALAVCPWCDESTPLRKLRLIRSVTFTDASGQPIDDRNFSGVDLTGVHPDDGYLGAGDSIEDISDHPTMADYRTRPTLTESTAESGFDSIGTDEEDEYRFAEPTVANRPMPMKVRPSTVQRRPKKSAWRSLAGIALGPPIAALLAYFILSAVGKVPDLGFWPFLESSNDASTTTSSRVAAPPMQRTVQSDSYPVASEPTVPGPIEMEMPDLPNGNITNAAGSERGTETERASQFARERYQTDGFERDRFPNDPIRNAAAISDAAPSDAAPSDPAPGDAAPSDAAARNASVSDAASKSAAVDDAVDSGQSGSDSQLAAALESSNDYESMTFDEMVMNRKSTRGNRLNLKTIPKSQPDNVSNPTNVEASMNSGLAAIVELPSNDSPSVDPPSVDPPSADPPSSERPSSERPSSNPQRNRLPGDDYLDGLTDSSPGVDTEKPSDWTTLTPADGVSVTEITPKRDISLQNQDSGPSLIGSDIREPIDSPGPDLIPAPEPRVEAAVQTGINMVRAINDDQREPGVMIKAAAKTYQHLSGLARKSPSATSSVQTLLDDLRSAKVLDLLATVGPFYLQQVGVGDGDGLLLIGTVNADDQTVTMRGGITYRFVSPIWPVSPSTVSGDIVGLGTIENSAGEMPTFRASVVQRIEP